MIGERVRRKKRETDGFILKGQRHHCCIMLQAARGGASLAASPSERCDRTFNHNSVFFESLKRIPGGGSGGGEGGEWKRRKKSIGLPSSTASIHNRSVIPQPPSLQCHIRRFRFKSILKSCSSISPTTGGLVLLESSPHKWQTGNEEIGRHGCQRTEEMTTALPGGRDGADDQKGGLGDKRKRNCLYSRALGRTGLFWRGETHKKGTEFQTDTQKVGIFGKSVAPVCQSVE